MELVFSAIVTGMFGVIVVLLNRNRVHAKEAKDQLVNDHEQPGKITNLRENIDHNQAETKGFLVQLLRGQNFQAQQIGRLFQMVGELRQDVDENTQDKRK